MTGEAGPTGAAADHDFFLSRRGSVAAIAREVEAVLSARGYRVFVQDYDIPFGASFIEAMHEGIKHSSDLLVLYTGEYESSRFTRKEFTSFEAERAQSPQPRRVVILRCEDVPLRGLFADNVYQDLVGIDDPEARKQRILAAAEGQSQAVRPRPPEFFGVPPRIKSFTGRDHELDRLDEILMGARAAAVTQTAGHAAVQGLGGVGKTSLATEYAHRFRELYSGVWWCPAETRVGLVGSLARLAVELGAGSATGGDAEVAAKAALRGLEKLRGAWLLVYDNVPSPDEIRDLLPKQGARVLITSRFPDWRELAGEVELDVLPMEEAVAFLQGRAARSDDKGAATLAAALGRLPLALNHAAAVCRRRGIGFAEYASQVASLIDTAPRGAAYPRSVKATFDLAIAEAVTRNPACEALMAFLAHCAPERIPMTLLERATDAKNECYGALDELVEVSLVKQDPFADGTPSVVVHRLVRLAASERLDAEARERALNRIVTALAEALPKGGRGSPQVWLLFPHLMEVLQVLNNEEHRESNARKYMDMLARIVVMALRFAEDKQLARQIGPDYLANVLGEFYEVDPLKGAIDLLLREHSEEWPKLQQQFLNANNYVLRYAMATCLADACIEPASPVRLADVIMLFDGAGEINAFEMGGYALGMIYARDPGLIDPAKLRALAECREYPGRSILGDLFLNLAFREDMRGRDLREMLDSDRFWNPIWDFIRLDVSAIRAAQAFMAEPGGATAGDAAPELRPDLARLQAMEAERKALASRELGGPIRALLADYWLLGQKKETVDEAKDEFGGISDPELLRGLMRLFFAHPLWAVAEAAATMLSGLVEDDPGNLAVIDKLLDDPDWRVQFGANETAFAVRHSHPMVFEQAVHRFHGHPICKIRGLCAENLFSWILNAGPEERIRLLADFKAEIQRWLMDDDCWVLDHVFCFFNKLHKRHIEVDPLLAAGVSPLFPQGSRWYLLERGDLLVQIERRKEESLASGRTANGSHSSP